MKTDSGRILDYLESLVARGRYHLTSKDAQRALGVSTVALKASMGRQRKKRRIATPYRGFHVIVAPEYRALGCPPPEHFIHQLMTHIGQPYYVGLLSAARLHGAGHQQPQVLQVVVDRNRPPVRCGAAEIMFVARHNMAAMPTTLVNTPRGQMRVASHESTAFDLVGYPQHAGGLDNVTTVLIELCEELDASELARIADLSPLPWSQRLGYLLERFDATHQTEPLHEYVRKSVREYIPLSTKGGSGVPIRDKRWRLTIDVEITPDIEAEWELDT